jgi:hypothetical protein
MVMRQVTGINVPFERNTIKLCRCTVCPVQTSSQCFEERVVKMDEALKAKRLNTGEIPAAYCAQGNACCTDIDPARSCICPTCQVYSQYHLASGQPELYFCRGGKAHSK